ncbi:MAG: DUF1559 domain-containing protein [Pirellulaceae bacterium]|nr:DUF1559 domain-containing protein [Pirellulaceae bacterium]
MQAMSMFGGLSVLVLAILGGGLPLGVPPEKENPVMGHVAPAECLMYASWASMAAPNPASTNQTEQLLAEPEIREFAAVLERSLGQVLNLSSRTLPGEPPAPSTAAAPLWGKVLLTRATAIFVTKFVPREPLPLVEGGLIVRAGEHAAQLDASLTEWLGSADQKPVESTIGGRKFHRLAASEAGLPMEVTWGVAGEYLMIGLGEKTLDDMIARVAARQEPAWLVQVKQQLPAERRCSVSYINAKKLTEALLPLAGPEVEQVVATLGLRQIGTLASVSAMDEAGIVSHSTLAIDGPPRGLVALLENEGIGKEDLAHIPSDALLASCWSLEASRVLDTILETIREVEPRAADEFEGELRNFEREFGVDVRATLAGLGNNWSLHAANADGGLMGVAVTVEVRDRARLLAAQEKLLAAWGQAQPGRGPAIAQLQFGGQTVYYLVPDLRRGMMFAPAWCLSEERLIVGLFPQGVKSVLARKAGDKSLADVPEVAAQLAAGKPPLAITYQDSARLFEAFYPSAQMLLPMVMSSGGAFGLPPDLAAALPTPRSVIRHLRPSVTVVRRTERGLETDTRQTLPGTNLGASAPLAVAMLLPALQASREAARRSQGSNNLRQQLLALHNFHDTFNRFPAAYQTDGDGKPLLSWRVALLPFIEEKALFDQFRLDEPWDSEHNKKLIPRMPRTFLAPGSRAAPGMTTYLGVGGKAGVLGAPRIPAKPDRPATGLPNGIGMAQVVDGTSNTIAIVEASDEAAVIWTKPEEWVPDQENPLKGLIGLRPNGFSAGFVDGHVQFIARGIDLQMLRALFTRDGGEVVDPRVRR